MAQNYMMGAGMVPPTAPTPPSQLSFKSDPNQRMQFKSFMQGLSAPQAPMAPPMAPPMMPMPQIPVPMQNIDVFSQPVQGMANGGRASRPQDRAKRAEEGRALARRIFSKPKREKDDDDRSRGFPSARRTVKITPQQEADARAELVKAAQTRAGSEDPSDYGQFVASARNRYRRPSSLSEQVAALSSVPADFGAEFGDDRRRRDSIATGIASTQTPADIINQSIQEALGVDPVKSQNIGFSGDPMTDANIAGFQDLGLGSALSEQISALRGPEDFGDEFGTDDLLNQINVVQNLGLEFGNQEQQEQMQGIGNLIGRSIPPTGLDRFNPFSQLGTKMSGNILSKINEGGEAVRDDSGMIVGVVHDGLLGGRVYTGRPGFNPFAPPTRPEREANPCPPGYTLVNGACMPISQPIAQATPATPAPNVISNIPVTTAAPSPVVQSTAPPVQLGMPLGQPSPIQPMSQFLTNIPNSLNLAANNFLSALSS